MKHTNLKTNKMTKELMKIDAPELQGIEKSKAEHIRATFEPMVEMLAKFEQAYNDVIKDSEKEITQNVIFRAKHLRSDIATVRIATEKIRKTEKEEYLRAGKAIDGVSNILKWAVIDKENKLKEIEDHFQIMEQERLTKLQIERIELLMPYVEDTEELDLSGMSDDVWGAYFTGKKKDYDDRIAAEKKAEAERIAKEKAEAEERERIRKENERLKNEAIERERLAKIEAEKREKLARIEAEKRAKEDAERKAKQEAERKKHEAQLQKEREEREKVQAELKAKQEAELKAKEEEAIRIQAELNKGDIAKIKDLVNDLSTLKTKYQFKAKKNQVMYNDVSILIDKIINHIKK